MYKPIRCPFCANIPVFTSTTDMIDKFDHGFSVSCTECGIEMNDEYQSEVVGRWNRRPSLSKKPDFPRVYLDLDGVMANFDAHFPALFGVDHRGILDDDMWSQINSHPSYFRDMPIFDGAKEFFDKISWLDPIILTACPKSNYAHAARQKRAWVREHLSTSCIILPVMGGRNKPLFMHAPEDILIDDFEKNIDAWVSEGGHGILHKGDFQETYDALGDVLDDRGLLA